jgi:ABC-type multidrug transport system permease subunit
VNRFLVIVATFFKEWKTTLTGWSYVLKIFGDATRTAALGWIIYQSGDREILAYLCVGLPLFSIWSGAVGLGGWSLEEELYGKTMDFILISRTKLPLILFGKTLGQVSRELPAGIISFGVILLVVRIMPEVSDIGLFVLSLPLALIGLAVMSHFLSALVVMVEGQAGFFMGIIALFALLSGFVLPVGNLPAALEPVGRLLPAAWAMESIWYSIQGNSLWLILRGWIMAAALSVVWFIITYYLCQIVEKRIRIKATLGTQ